MKSNFHTATKNNGFRCPTLIRNSLCLQINFLLMNVIEKCDTIPKRLNKSFDTNSVHEDIQVINDEVGTIYDAV